jgi:two-component system, LuxR family, response regulator FixJ
MKPDTVAIADDDDGVRDSLQFLLEAAGHKVEAFAAAADFPNGAHQHIACLLLDHQMPAMTGLELVQRLQLSGVAIPILLMTDATSPNLVTRAVALGIVRVLEKPMDGDDVLAIVEATMRSL